LPLFTDPRVGHVLDLGQAARHGKNILPYERSGRTDSAYAVLPNALPLPAKGSPTQDEPRANKMAYVIEI
jgi:hypothetical protein